MLVKILNFSIKRKEVDMLDQLDDYDLVRFNKVRINPDFIAYIDPLNSLCAITEEQEKELSVIHDEFNASYKGDVVRCAGKTMICLSKVVLQSGKEFFCLTESTENKF